MPVQPGVWGIDIGQSALKAVRLERVEGVITATAFEYIEHPKILSQPDADPEALTREALASFLERNPVRTDEVAIGIAGQSGLARFVKLPPVEEKNIPNVVKFEAKMQIPFPLEEVVWDYQRIGQGVVTDGFAVDAEVGLFAMKRDVINKAMKYYTDADVEVHVVQMSPLALCNYVTYDLLNKGGDPIPADDEEEDEDGRGKRQCVVALDIGTEGSSLVITDGERIIWQRPIPIGGNQFTKALSKELKLTFAKAEHVKRNAAKSPDLAKILKALKPVLNDFVGEVQRSLGFFTNSNRDAHIRYMMGLGSAFRLPGLQKFLSEKLGLEVRKPDAFRRLVGDTVTTAPNFSENVLSFPVAYGLALQALGVGRITTNLLPQEIVIDRKIRAKKPWAAAAAAMLLLGTSVMAFGYASDYGSLVDKSISGGLEKGESALKLAQQTDSAVSAKQSEVAATQGDVKTIISGQDEQRNWVRLNQYINACLPKPGPGGNLMNPDQQVFWSSKEGQDALADFQKRVAGGIPIDQPVDYPLRRFLATVDLEAMHSRYTDNLTPVMEAAKKRTLDLTGLELNGMLPADAAKLPEGPGWIIELRGTTFHEKGRDFIKACLVRNLAVGVPATGPIRVTEGQELTAEQKADPILGKLTHVFLFDTKEVKQPQPNAFEMINTSVIDGLVGGNAAGGAGGTMGMPGMGPGGGPPPGMGDMAAGGGGGGAADPAASAAARLLSWTPVATGGAAAGGMGGMGGMPGMPGYPGAGGGGLAPPGRGPGMMSGGSGMPGPGMPGMAGGGGAPAPSAAPPPANIVPRWEFVVIFVWKEPLPSDALAAEAAK